jgi:DNA-binding NarL/FixJ family response regulator
MPIAVAIVEDDAATRDILADWIEHSAEFRCVARLEDAESALRELPKESPEVVLVDINLPGVLGIECVRRLKPQMPDTQFVMITVYGDSAHIFEALAAGATGYLLKRVTRDGLLGALREAHHGGSPMSSAIARKVVQFFQGTPRMTASREGLSARENEVLALLAGGYGNKEIADRLGLSTPTVATYIRRIYEKLHVSSRAGAVGRFSIFGQSRPVGT